MITNPAAGRGRGAAAADAAEARLRELGVEPRRLTGESADDTRRLMAEAIASGPDLIALVGGDGTLAAVVDEAAAARIPLALIPAGTGNDLARALGIPYGSPEAAADAAALIVHGATASLDVGEAICPEGSRRFLTIAALGFDAKVSERTNSLRWPRGKARYYLALVIELLRLRPTAFTIAFDGEAPEPAAGTLVAVGNTRSYGGGMPVCPDADPQDGMLDVVRVAPLGRLRLLRLFPRLLNGTHLALPEASSRPVREVTVSAPDLLVYADGERVGSGTVRIRILPGALRIVLPAGRRA
nr:YegS/Rv2252/BmrU family lipid kinase [Microbacterium pseudoresistens]